MSNPHFQALERMYLAGPINRFYAPTISIKASEAAIEITLGEKFHHSAGAVHGCVYFKMLDDAAFFAVQSLETKVFVLTATFTTYLIRPVSMGKLRSVGKVVSRSATQFIAEAVVYNENDKEIGRGSGVFVKGKLPLAHALGYA
ncbi:MAG: PaaI family thioesterase [Rhodanobacter sp.]|jgi:uncharacterized protein (TIGR00369 family)|nr:PaaI family thioesterase [Rhodanobacter sp.]